jgi:hypothetical protein
MRVKRRYAILMREILDSLNVSMNMETIQNLLRRSRLGYWLLGAGSAVLALGILLLLSAYTLPSSWGGVRSVRDLLPLPVVLVSGAPVATYADVSGDLLALRTFYESQDFSSIGLRVDFSTTEGKERLRFREREILNKIVEDGVIRKLSKAEGISFSEEEAYAEVLKRAEQANSAVAASENVSRLYGWDLGRFAERVVLPDLYRTALEERYEGDDSRFAAAESRIMEAHKMLDDGRSFSDVASELSDGRSAEEDGSMGWFTYDQLIEPLEAVARAQEIGIPGDIVESPLGFHIILVTGRRTGEGEEMVEVSQIFAKKQTFGEWLAEQMKETDVRVLAPEYEWNPETATVEFRDEALRLREQELLEQSEGDASVMF